MNKNKNVIEVRNLEKSFSSFLRKEKPVLSSLTFEVRKGKITGFLGPNGAGKTTTIRIILGFLKPDNGTISLFGETREKEDDFKRKIGYLPESPSIYPFLSGKETLRISAELANIPQNEIDDRINNLVQLFQLDEFYDKKIKSYSKGMMKKLAFALALIADPDLLILDEPLTGLDPLVMVEIRNYIKKLHRQGKSMFISSHLLSEMEKICEDVILINRGKKVLAGNLKELLENKIIFSVSLQDNPKISNFLQKEKKWNLKIKNNWAGTIIKKEVSAEIISELQQKFSSINYEIKPANLEDLFLFYSKKNTGENSTLD